MNLSMAQIIRMQAEIDELRAALKAQPVQPAPLTYALQAILDLSAGWDEHGSTGPKVPWSWESVGRMAMDYARAALRTGGAG